jgi:two-component system nitrogen regulation response regulator GlnG
VRELQSVIKQALLNARGNTLLAAFLPDFGTVPIERSQPLRTMPEGSGFDIDAYVRSILLAKAGDVHDHTHREVDRRLLLIALEHTSGNQREAARILGISRQTMRVRLRSLGMHISRSVGLDDDP